MSIGDRLLMIIYLVAMNLLVIALLGVSLGLIPATYLNKQLTFIDGNWQLAGFLVLVLAGGIYILLKGFKWNRKGQRAIVQYTELGELKVMLDAIESLVERAVAQIKGVREVKPFVFKANNGLGVNISVTVVADLNIPELSKDIQNVVYEHLQNTVGITANPITVTVRNIAREGAKIR